MQKFSKDELDTITKALEDCVGTSYVCDKCGAPSSEHTLVDSFIVMSMRRHPDDKMAFLPFIGVVCTKCGALTMHVLQALGLNWLWEAAY